MGLSGDIRDICEIYGIEDVTSWFHQAANPNDVVSMWPTTVQGRGILYQA